MSYNEAKVIAKRIENLVELDYPKSQYEIIVADSGSADNAAQVVEDAT
ncbi:MAG: glycosyltransferase [Euryarchaeota archaeon]|nr:glycosyltransferase [Euryarchaeota archaeon]